MCTQYVHEYDCGHSISDASEDVAPCAKSKTKDGRCPSSETKIKAVIHDEKCPDCAHSWGIITATPKFCMLIFYADSKWWLILRIQQSLFLFLRQSQYDLYPRNKYQNTISTTLQTLYEFPLANWAITPTPIPHTTTTQISPLQKFGVAWDVWRVKSIFFRRVLSFSSKAYHKALAAIEAKDEIKSRSFPSLWLCANCDETAFFCHNFLVFFCASSFY
jgi:hypothetical protein